MTTTFAEHFTAIPEKMAELYRTLDSCTHALTVCIKENAPEGSKKNIYERIQTLFSDALQVRTTINTLNKALSENLKQCNANSSDTERLRSLQEKIQEKMHILEEHRISLAEIFIICHSVLL